MIRNFKPYSSFNSFANWLILHPFLSSAEFFKHTIRVSNGLDPDQGQHSVDPELSPNCLQRLPAFDRSRHKQGKSYIKKH